MYDTTKLCHQNMSLYNQWLFMCKKKTFHAMISWSIFTLGFVLVFSREDKRYWRLGKVCDNYSVNTARY